jgi:hypothetical protein
MWTEPYNPLYVWGSCFHQNRKPFIQGGASVQQGLSAAFGLGALGGLLGAADKRYSLGFMFDLLSTTQKIVLFMLVLVWAFGIRVIWRKSWEARGQAEEVDRFFNWKRWTKPYDGSVQGWLSDKENGLGQSAPGKVSRWDVIWTWTALVAFVMSLLVFEWTRLDVLR